VCVCWFFRKHIPELAWEKVRGSAEREREREREREGERERERERLQNRIPRQVWGLTTGEQNPSFVTPGCHMCTPRISPPPYSPPWQDRPREWVVARLMSTTAHASWERGNDSCFFFSISCHLLYFLSVGHTLCVYLMLFMCSLHSLLSPLWGIANAVWRKPGKRHLPYIMQRPPLPPSLSLSVPTILLLLLLLPGRLWRRVFRAALDPRRTRHSEALLLMLSPVEEPKQ